MITKDQFETLVRRDLKSMSHEERGHAYQHVRDTRLAVQAQAEALKELESALSKSLIDEIEVGKGFVSGGFVFTIESREKPILKDWNAFIGWVAQTGRTDTLQKRLSDKAIMDTPDWKKLPGIELFNHKSLSVRKK